MTSKYSLRIRRFFTLISLIFVTNSAFAEFLCHSSVSYVWKKTQDEAEAEVFWARLDRRAADEAAGKRLIEEALAVERGKALAGCQADHENLAGCVAGKFSSLAPTLQRLSFTQRKSIEDAVNSDCSARQGKCSTIKVADVVCSELVTASSSSSAAAGKDAGKDAKKKK